MQRSRQIERQWLRNFSRSALVDQWSGKFKFDIARQFYYKKEDPDYPADLPCDFERVFQDYPQWPNDQVVTACLQFLGAIGIKIKPSRLYEHLVRYPNDLSTLVTKTHYILKTLAHADQSLDVTNPYRDNDKDIFFLSRIASGKSVLMGQLNLFEDLEIPDLHRRLSSLPEGYGELKEVQDLFRAIEDSNTSFFITGKAGTGKSTFIHYFAQHTKKKVLLTAFTGIAAINVHGQTLHSLFQFPFKPLSPEDEDIKIFGEFSERRKIIEKVQTIVIDEVSMLRADILQALDHSLRRNGGDPQKVFGGKQLIFIGDIFQLPPVLNNQDEAEGEVFRELYESEYFFGAAAYRDLAPRFFQFEKSYRQQSDQEFVELLDKIRLCRADQDCLEKINKRYRPDHVHAEDEFVIHLTSTNLNARMENSGKLGSLPYTEYCFDATVMGEFPEMKVPAEQELRLKRGAQVMFVKNDPKKRWVNGTIGRIEFISSDCIEVKLQNGQVHKVERDRWESRKYRFDRVQRKIVTEVTGTFEQYPLKLAWAITIHKSQGLTFDKVIIDFGTGAFVNGQVYTALSRCRTLEGIFLKSELRKQDLIADPRLVEFYEGLVGAYLNT